MRSCNTNVVFNTRAEQHLYFNDVLFLEMLKPVDRIEILVLVDNKSDSLSTIPASVGSKNFCNEFVNLMKNGMTELKGSSQCCALHGLSLLVTAHRGSKSKTVLFDAGKLFIVLSNTI